MKTIILSILLISSMSFANRESGGRLGASAIYVYFYSHGTGIDTKSQALYQNLISKAKAHGLVVDEMSERRGREGETLNCVELKSPFERYNFIKKLAPSILADTASHGMKRTSVYVGTDCRDVRKATEQNLSTYKSN